MAMIKRSKQATTSDRLQVTEKNERWLLSQLRWPGQLDSVHVGGSFCLLRLAPLQLAPFRESILILSAENSTTPTINRLISSLVTSVISSGRGQSMQSFPLLLPNQNDEPRHLFRATLLDHEEVVSTERARGPEGGSQFVRP